MLREFVTIHVKERAWQVVKLFWDELIRRDRRNNDEDAVSFDLISRTLSWWPTNEDQDLEVLCKLLTESDCKLDNLHLSSNKVTDEGVKHIAEALSNSHCALNSLHLSECSVTDEGAKHIAEALSNSNCALNSLDLSHCKVRDEGVKHIAEALSNSHCHLNSLDLHLNDQITDKGVRHLARVLEHSKYKLKSSSELDIKVTAKVKEQVSEEGLS